MSILKMTEEEAIIKCEKLGLDWSDSGYVMKECSVCESHVMMDDIGAEVEISGNTYYDVCDDCADNLEN